jgi:protein-L-isoaspartate(D-aspartate) O-methyltransferase
VQIQGFLETKPMGMQHTDTSLRRLSSLLLGLGVWIILLVAQEHDQGSLPSQSRMNRVTPGQATARASDPNHNVPDDVPQENRRHPAFGERTKERQQMVHQQMKLRGTSDPNVLAAMQAVPRHAFVLPQYQGQAYADYPLPIDHNQTISQPYIVAFMTEALALDPNDRVLEIGTGSGYQAAVCAEIAKEVYSIEIIEPLAQSAAKRLKDLGYENVHVRGGDGFFGWPEHAPFDAIIGTAAAGRIPPPLLEQLKVKGRMILPQEDDQGFQYLIMITKASDGKIQRKTILPVRFVPMTGEVNKE